MKKAISIFLTVLMLMIFFTGCSNDNKSSSRISVKMSDLPYGSTMVNDNKNYKIPILYDKRFLEANQLKAVTDYYYSIQAKDLALYEATMIPIFSEFIKANSSTGEADAKYILENAHSTLNAMIGENFKIKSCEITAITTEKVISGIDTVLEKMNLVSKEIDGTRISDKIKKGYAVTVSFTVQSGEKSTIISDDILYLFEMDDKIYVLI
ncbi:MAG: hypothetical protein GX286_03040 [Clostridiales bacterium]|nr:hypothetical protein [Clostridiales bacterium]